jgi:hypothetical protein
MYFKLLIIYLITPYVPNCKLLTFDFILSQTYLNLTKFIEKYISIYYIKWIHYQNMFHDVSNEYSLT